MLNELGKKVALPFGKPRKEHTETDRVATVDDSPLESHPATVREPHLKTNQAPDARPPVGLDETPVDAQARHLGRGLFVATTPVNVKRSQDTYMSSWTLLRFHHHSTFVVGHLPPTHRAGLLAAADRGSQ